MPTMFERATRECRMSPTIATRSPSKRSNSWRRVIRSSSACVGCACVPSPAFTTWPANASASRRANPDSGWRTTITRTPIPCSVSAVSAIVSPFPRLEAPGAKVITSAPTRCSASVNEVAVRVEASKKRLRTGTPASRSRAGSWSRNATARSRTETISPGLRSSTSSRLRGGTVLVEDRDRVGIRTLRAQHHVDVLAAAGRNHLADVVGLDRKLAQPPVDQHGKPDRARPAEIGDRVERGADGASGVEHVVDEHDGQSGDRAANLRLRQLARDVVVAVQVHVQKAELRKRTADLRDLRSEPAGQPLAAAPDPDQQEPVLHVLGLDDLVGHARDRPFDLVG